MTVSQEIAGLKLGSKTKIPSRWHDGFDDAEIIGFRHYTSRNNGRTYVVADFLYTNPEGKVAQGFEAVDAIVRAANEAARQTA